MNLTAKIDDGFRNEIRTALARHLTSLGSARVLVEDTVDHDGDPIIMVRAVFLDELEDSIGWDLRNKMHKDIWRIVRKHDINSFPHLMFTTEDAFKRSA